MREAACCKTTEPTCSGASAPLEREALAATKRSRMRQRGSRALQLRPDAAPLPPTQNKNWLQFEQWQQWLLIPVIQTGGCYCLHINTSAAKALRHSNTWTHHQRFWLNWTGTGASHRWAWKVPQVIPICNRLANHCFKRSEESLPAGLSFRVAALLQSVPVAWWFCHFFSAKKLEYYPWT